MEALEAKKKKLLLGKERYEELRKLNQIHKMMDGHSTPEEVSEAMPALSLITRSTTRRL